VSEGGLWSSVEDLAHWLSAQFRIDAGARGSDRVLADATLREMHRPRYLSDESWTEAFCICWAAQRRGDEVWIGHSGGLPGFISDARFHHKEPVGAIVLLNGHANASELASELGERALAAVRGAVCPAAVPAPVPDAYVPLLGLYGNDDWPLPLSVEWRDDRLTLVSLEDRAWLRTLTPTDDPWTFVVDPGVRESGEAVVFDRRLDGCVRSVRVAAENLARLDPVFD
jgi:hypothetical protein